MARLKHAPRYQQVSHSEEGMFIDRHYDLPCGCRIMRRVWHGVDGRSTDVIDLGPAQDACPMHQGFSLREDCSLRIGATRTMLRRMRDAYGDIVLLATGAPYREPELTFPHDLHQRYAETGQSMATTYLSLDLDTGKAAVITHPIRTLSIFGEPKGPPLPARVREGRAYWYPIPAGVYADAVAAAIDSGTFDVLLARIVKGDVDAEYELRDALSILADTALDVLRDT